jgi:hypothetical protein
MARVKGKAYRFLVCDIISLDISGISLIDIRGRDMGRDIQEGEGAATMIANLEDKSFSLTPEFLYTGITNLELRLRTGFICGPRGTEFGDKPNDFRIDFRIRYYF